MSRVLPSDGRRGLSRRALLQAATAGALAGGPAAAMPAAPARIATLDYGLAETLLALGRPPLAIAEADEWAVWVVDPPLPAGTVNLGSALEPNLEVLTALRPDLILTTPYLGRITPILHLIAPTRRFAIYAPEVGAPYEASVAATRQLATELGVEGAGERLVAQVEAAFAEVRARHEGRAGEPVFVVNFMDARHVRVYGEHSLFDAVLRRCGLANAWQGPTNYWGFATVGIEQLAQMPAARLLYLEPVTPDVLGALARSPLWNSLGFVRAGRVQRMPAVLMFGMLPSAQRFARLIDAALASATGSDDGG